jgi:hypothetical protein
MPDRHDEDVAEVLSAARSALNAARCLAREAVSEAERRCFASLAERIRYGIQVSGPDPEALAEVGPEAGGLTLVGMLLVDRRADKYRLAKAILRRWFWPRDLRPAGVGPAPRPGGPRP